MLYLIATPIGNLLDITFRAIAILKECDYILCEDTRHSRILLNHFEITTPLKSFHQFNESASLESICEDLQADKKIGLISDAGTPTISDPGERLVKLCVAKNIPISPIPGPCAAICALICSGFETSPFQFLGFLPQKKIEKEEKFSLIIDYPGSTILYEAPHRVISLLKEFLNLIPERQIMICRELSKKFETFYYGSLKEVLANFDNIPLKGEFIIVIEGNKNKMTNWEMMSIEDHVQFMMQTYGIDKKQAIKMVAELRGIPKKNVYNIFHQ